MTCLKRERTAHIDVYTVVTILSHGIKYGTELVSAIGYYLRDDIHAFVELRTYVPEVLGA